MKQTPDKPCAKCGKTAPEVTFSPGSYVRKCDGKRKRRSDCDACKRIYGRQWRKDNPRIGDEPPLIEPYQEDAVKMHIARVGMILGETEAILDQEAEEAFKRMAEDGD